MPHVANTFGMKFIWPSSTVACGQRALRKGIVRSFRYDVCTYTTTGDLSYGERQATGETRKVIVIIYDCRHLDIVPYYPRRTLVHTCGPYSIIYINNMMDLFVAPGIGPRVVCPTLLLFTSIVSLKRINVRGTSPWNLNFDESDNFFNRGGTGNAGMAPRRGP